MQQQQRLKHQSQRRQVMQKRSVQQFEEENEKCAEVQM
jgi:hypothetical protein